MTDARSHDGLTLEARDERGISEQRPMENLHGDVAVDAQLSSSVDARHCTLTHELFDAEVFVDDSPDERVTGVIEPCGLWHAASLPSCTTSLAKTSGSGDVWGTAVFFRWR
jgi:hypothetical protein